MRTAMTSTVSDEDAGKDKASRTLDRHSDHTLQVAERTLIFSSDQVRWSCQCASWQDKYHLERSDFSVLVRAEHDCLPTLSIPMPPRWAALDEQYRQCFRTVVSNYSGRKLTYKQDRLDAFTGIMTKMTHLERVRKFLWGLTGEDFEDELAWRHIQHCDRGDGEYGDEYLRMFPSWSWLSYLHPVSFIELSVFSSENKSLVKCFRLVKENSTISCRDISAKNAMPDTRNH